MDCYKEGRCSTGSSVIWNYCHVNKDIIITIIIIYKQYFVYVWKAHLTSKKEGEYILIKENLL